MTRPFAIQAIDHVVLRAHDVPALVAFYADTLGCPVERTIEGLTQLRAGNALIDIVMRDPDDRTGGNMDHLCLTLDPFDADKIAAWLGATGVAIGEIATRYGAGGFGVSIYLTDPEGNGLELRAAR
ncbi:MAG: VOC family protein [Lysobacteraceae bacterium]|nr:MAG: VOC family protein [Xanthomonadaceae bacterium]